MASCRPCRHTHDSPIAASAKETFCPAPPWPVTLPSIATQEPKLGDKGVHTQQGTKFIQFALY
eukprot:515086-Amphidinium_carterae.2